MNTDERFISAFKTRDIEEFLKLIFPPTWQGIASRIIESGVQISTEMCPWAPKWSKIPPTVRNGTTEFETAVKSCIFRVHDCLHQLWGLPLPSAAFSEEDFYLYKRSQMCGEVAVLTLTEFVFCKYAYEQFADTSEIIRKRNAIPMLEGPLQSKTPLQIALRMDDLLHKKRRPKWVRDCKAAVSFVDDYVPMLEYDRRDIDHNWNIMKSTGWRPVSAPNARYNLDLDGLELTTWMVTDFYHLMDTDVGVDTELRDFNRSRRESIKLPDGWGLPK